MVDLETRKIVDMIESREMTDVRDWLRSYPNLRVVSRDGSHTYAAAITAAHPEAMQISDRFHLVKNLTGYATDALQKLFQGRIAIPITSETRRIRTMMLVSTLAERVHLIKQLHKEGRSKTEIVQMTGASAKTVNQYIAMSESDIPLDKQTVRGREHEEAVDKLLLRAQRVRALREEGYSITAIVQRTGFTANVIRNYLSEDFSPVNAHYGKQREGKLEPFRDEVFQMRLEGVTYREINRRIQERGYSGTEDAIRGFLSKERRVQRDLLALTGGEPIEFIDKKWLIRLLYNPLDKVKGITEDQLAAIFTAYPLAASIIELVDEFRCILRSKAPLKLLTWMERAAGLKITQLNTFINGLKHDIDAVMNAVASDFSNGLAEGTVNKIKVIKRIMYGRCHFCLLRSKCLLLQNL
jgi:predicted transcriptional regulator